jgi:hypothetical protein
MQLATDSLPHAKSLMNCQLEAVANALKHKELEIVSKIDNGKSQSINGFSIPNPVGCCTGQALGCGCSFVGAWVISLILSTLLTSFVGRSDVVQVLLSGLTCIGSLVMAAVLSFLTGRFFPVIKNQAE